MTEVGRVESVNVGRPAEIAWRGRPVHTAIDKRPVAQRVPVGRLHLDGDGQADLVGHGGEHRAVFVYQRESYRYWETELGRDLPRPGSFGENLTVSGLPDDDVRIGDRLHIGSAEFEVTQPRVTCFKVGIALAEPRMPALLTGHGRPGFYLRVLREGDVGAGDVITRTGRAPDALSVRATSDLLYGTRHEPDLLRRAIATTALPAGWRDSFTALLETAVDHGTFDAVGNTGLRPAATPAGWTGFRSFTLDRTHDESPTVRSFHLRPSDGSPLPRHEPGQFLTVRLAPTGDGEALIRSYTVSAPSDGNRLRISVRRAGAGSTRLWGLRPGDVLEVAAPRGAFTVPDDARAPLLLASAGVGITPMIAILADLAARHDRRPVRWLHVARDGADDPFAADAAALLARLPDAIARIHHTAADAPTHAGAHPGRPTRRDLEELALSADTHALLCGPPGFMDSVRDLLLDVGLTASRIRTEAFGAATGPPRTAAPAHPDVDAGPPARDGLTVTFARTGRTVRWTSRRGSLLELAEDNAIPVEWSCRSGVCHRCQSGLIGGRIAYDPLPLDEPPTGTVLLCCAVPRDAVVLDL